MEEKPSNTAATEEWTANAPVGAWATSGDMNTARFNLGGLGITTAALGFGGREPTVPAITESIMELVGLKLMI